MSDTLSWMGQGAALGTAIMPGVGTAVGAAVGGLASLAAQVFPGLHPSLATAERLAPVVAKVLGTTDPEAAQDAVDADPDARAALSAALAAMQAAEFKNTADARATTVELAKTGSLVVWEGVVVDSMVMTAFLVVLCTVLFHGLPEAGTSRDVVIGLFGTVSTLAVTIVNFWRGSSAGSVRKTELLNNAH